MSSILPIDSPFEAPENGFQAIRFDGRVFHLLDQRELPARERWLQLDDLDSVIAAIRDLAVRGAPAIGITAAYGAVIRAREVGLERGPWLEGMARLEAARPTAVNLSWAVARMRRAAGEAERVDLARLEAEARAIHAEDIAANQAMARAGGSEIGACRGILTHCNTGSLATGGVGTALGVIIQAAKDGRVERVFADETRPWLQGSRLTAWELARAGVEARVLVEGAAAALMAAGEVQWVVVGADRIAANGDVANKIGTYALAVLARHHGVKMMVVAPSSTLDPAMENGQGIEIEQRAADEIWAAAGLTEAPAGFAAWNPVFDVTPGELIDCIVTEQGVHRPPYDFSGAR
ncbi:S-methyl-5-thioribose-1-phosphate isomerase [Wenzhouxiangella marina]|uniref:Methylthioribose-1-phosphate isomerase n=1 Tax=Wenzhouxiangella marina TaxID=1579979 RepID=A0A0K0XVZ9_9GAMM|nr:S-methyl-5-thioribose-1-phosphate isomerase [Wenzhouxiangella marina]AKS41802.1 Methylthioribose-1-phosphate isomerase [Wenzhouxiangella marina]MBB6086436.1 methylthioribose-1-phosphate isomerase [Wenzhouxiangella marina]